MDVRVISLTKHFPKPLTRKLIHEMNEDKYFITKYKDKHNLLLGVVDTRYRQLKPTKTFSHVLLNYTVYFI